MTEQEMYMMQKEKKTHWSLTDPHMEKEIIERKKINLRKTVYKSKKEIYLQLQEYILHSSSPRTLSFSALLMVNNLPPPHTHT